MIKIITLINIATLNCFGTDRGWDHEDDAYREAKNNTHNQQLPTLLSPPSSLNEAIQPLISYSLNSLSNMRSLLTSAPQKNVPNPTSRTVGRHRTQSENDAGLHTKPTPPQHLVRKQSLSSSTQHTPPNAQQVFIQPRNVAPTKIETIQQKKEQERLSIEQIAREKIQHQKEQERLNTAQVVHEINTIFLRLKTETFEKHARKSLETKLVFLYLETRAQGFRLEQLHIFKIYKDFRDRMAKIETYLKIAQMTPKELGDLSKKDSINYHHFHPLSDATEYILVKEYSFLYNQIRRYTIEQYSKIPALMDMQGDMSKEYYGPLLPKEDEARELNDYGLLEFCKLSDDQHYLLGIEHLRAAGLVLKVIELSIRIFLSRDPKEAPSSSCAHLSSRHHEEPKTTR
jgi:hypothetical protein